MNLPRHSGASRSEAPGIHNHRCFQVRRCQRSTISVDDSGYGFRAHAFGVHRNDGRGAEGAAS